MLARTHATVFQGLKGIVLSFLLIKNMPKPLFADLLYFLSRHLGSLYNEWGEIGTLGCDPKANTLGKELHKLANGKC